MLVVNKFLENYRLMLTTNIIINNVLKVFIIPNNNSFVLLTMTAFLGTCLLSSSELEKEDIS